MKTLTKKQILGVVKEVCRTAPDKIITPRRGTKPESDARLICYLLMREFTQATFESIADTFGRTHGAVVHGANKARVYLETNRKFADLCGAARAECEKIVRQQNALLNRA